MSHRQERNLELIKDLCRRLGFSCASEDLETDGGLQSLLPQIQERLNQLQDQDTYGDVEEIPTDTCPILYAGPPIPEVLDDDEIFSHAVNSLMKSMLSAQLRLMLVSQTLASVEAADAATASKGVADSARVEQSLNPLLAEIRSEALLKAVLLSVVQAAAEAVGSPMTSLCSSSRTSTCESNTSNFRRITGSSLPRSERTASSATAAVSTSVATATATASSLSRRRAVISSKILDGLPQKAPPPTPATAAQPDTTSASSRQFAGFPCYSSSGELRPPGKFSSSWGHGLSRVRDDSDEAGGIGEGRRQHRGGRGISSPNSQSSLQQARGIVDGGVEQIWTQQMDAEVISYSNMEARWRGRTIQQRRQEFYWPIEDAYQIPYEGTEAVARDQWQFARDHKGFCPAYARLNRTYRAEMTELRRQNRLNDIAEENRRGVSSPIELYNGVVHPLGPSAASCRAAFVGE